MVRAGRSPIPISLNEEETDQLIGIARSRTLPHGMVRVRKSFFPALKESPTC